MSTPSFSLARTYSPFLRPIALLSYHPNPTHESSAPRRRLAAGRATEQLPVVRSAVSRALAGGLTPSRHGCRAPRVPPTATRFGVPAASCCPGCPDAHRAWSPCPCLPSASACPASTRPRLASGACPASACPGLRVRCRASGVRCPVSMSGVRVPCRRRVSGVRCKRPAFVRVASVSALSAPESSWSARVRWQPHASGPAGSACHPTMSATGSSAAQRDLNLGPSLVRDNQALVTTSRTSITCSYPVPSEPRSDRC